MVNTHSDQRYTDLTPIRYGEITTGNRGSDPRKRSSRIDPGYGTKKPQGPSPKDLELLSAPNPTVSVNLRMRGSGGGSGGDNRGTGTGTGVGKGYTGGTVGASMGSGGQGVNEGRVGAALGGLESSVDPRTLMPKFSMDI